MRIPRDLAKRIEHVKKAVRKRLGSAVTQEQIRHEIKLELAQEKFMTLVAQWESEFEEILSGSDVRALTEAFDELILRIEREPLMETDVWGPEGVDRLDPIADLFIVCVKEIRRREIRRIDMENQDSENWEPTRFPR